MFSNVWVPDWMMKQQHRRRKSEMFNSNHFFINFELHATSYLTPI